MLRAVGLHNGLASVVGRRVSQASMRAFGTHKGQSSLERHRSNGGLLASASRSFEQRGDDLLFGAPLAHCAFSSTPQTHWIWQRKSWRFSTEKKEKKKFKLPKLSDLGTLDGWDPNAPFTYPPPPNEDDKARAIRLEKEKLINQYCLFPSFPLLQRNNVLIIIKKKQKKNASMLLTVLVLVLNLNDDCMLDDDDGWMVSLSLSPSSNK